MFATTVTVWQNASASLTTATPLWWSMAQNNWALDTTRSPTTASSEETFLLERPVLNSSTRRVRARTYTRVAVSLRERTLSRLQREAKPTFEPFMIGSWLEASPWSRSPNRTHRTVASSWPSVLRRFRSNY